MQLTSFPVKYIPTNLGLLINRLFIISCILILSENLSGSSRFSIESNIDSVWVENNHKSIKLTRDSVLDNTLKIFRGDSTVTGFNFNHVKGEIILQDIETEGAYYYVFYQYLHIPIPTRLGPAIVQFPHLDNAFTRKQNDPVEIKSSVQEPSYPLITSGTFSRGISVSSFGGMTLDGGLQLSMQGRLSEKLTVAGTLSDQNTPIQPEGDTRTLSEIDKVYLEVYHASFTITAGDLEIENKNNRYMAFSKRLEGMNFHYKNNQVEFRSFFGKSQGKYKKNKISGIDKNQGPYQLSGENNSRNIIVLAGTEKVWLNGELLVRGENNDFTIDYSTSEITFTAKRIIDVNSRIIVEFEFSDFIFPRQVSGIEMNKQIFNDRITASMGWIREMDGIEPEVNQQLNDDELDLLTDAGDSVDYTRFITAVEDSSGQYVKHPNPDNSDDSIFVYLGNDEPVIFENKYSVTFYNLGPEGEYKKKISETGEIYFEFVPISERDNSLDFYVPWRPLNPPKNHQIVDFSFNLNFSDSSQINLEIAGSQNDLNLYSDLNDNDNDGLAGAVTVKHFLILPQQLGRLNLKFSSSNENSKFSSLQRSREVEFDREWNLNDLSTVEGSGGNISITEYEIGHKLGDSFRTGVSNGNYNDGIQKINRQQYFHYSSTKWIPELQFEHTQSKRGDLGVSEYLIGESVWQRDLFSISMLPGNIHPYFISQTEERSDDFKFHENGIGINIDGSNFNAKAGVQVRMDYNLSETNVEWEKISHDTLAMVDFKTQYQSGLKLNLTMKYKIKSFFNDNENQQYGLARGTIGYTPRHGIVNSILDLKLEESLFEQKIVFYDSVGSGLGNYRYDSDYDQYSPDIEGDFIKRTVLSGIRTPSSHLKTGLKLFFDFERTRVPFIKSLTWKFIGNSDFNGNSISLQQIIHPDLNMNSIQFSRIAVHQEVTYSPRLSNRKIQLSQRYLKDVNHISLNESFDKTSQFYSGRMEDAIKRNLTVSGLTSWSRNDVVSSNSASERYVNSTFFENGLRWRMSKRFEWGGDIRFGFDSGQNSIEKFETTLFGLGIQSKLFSNKSGRIQSSVDWYSVTSPVQLASSLPPEAAQGNLIGENLKLTITGILQFENNLSSTLNVFYLKDSLHDGVFSFTGELSASF
tara:strand:+ start:11269 stop:14697 length:3429 start_codon:yes stop_codon:yes gene_type:complete